MKNFLSLSIFTMLILITHTLFSLQKKSTSMRDPFFLNSHKNYNSEKNSRISIIGIIEYETYRGIIAHINDQEITLLEGESFDTITLKKVTSTYVEFNENMQIKRIPVGTT